MTLKSPTQKTRPAELAWPFLKLGTNTIGYAQLSSRSHHAVVRVYDEAGNVIETHEH